VSCKVGDIQALCELRPRAVCSLHSDCASGALPCTDADLAMFLTSGWVGLVSMLRQSKRGYARLAESAPDALEASALDERLLEDEQYRLPPSRPFPRREIVMGFVLLVLGLALMLLGLLDHLEHWKNHVPGAKRTLALQRPLRKRTMSRAISSLPHSWRCLCPCCLCWPGLTCCSPCAGSPIAFACLGMLVFVPGAYASCIATGSYMGWSGFSYDQMPRMQGV
jgi:hypothetical protein